MNTGRLLATLLNALGVKPVRNGSVTLNFHDWRLRGVEEYRRSNLVDPVQPEIVAKPDGKSA